MSSPNRKRQRRARRHQEDVRERRHERAQATEALARLRLLDPLSAYTEKAFQDLMAGAFGAASVFQDYTRRSQQAILDAMDRAIKTQILNGSAALDVSPGYGTSFGQVRARLDATTPEGRAALDRVLYELRGLPEVGSADIQAGSDPGTLTLTAKVADPRYRSMLPMPLGGVGAVDPRPVFEPSGIVPLVLPTVGDDP